MADLSNQEIFWRLLLAVLAGGLIGYQREKHERPAGLRTHILVALGSAVIMLISAYGFQGRQFADPARIASQVVVGIGFLGAGTIIRQGNIVIGLTTAASLWTVAAVGLALGLGWYSLAILTTAIIFLVLTLFKRLEDKYWKKRLYQIELTALQNLEGLEKKLDKKGLIVDKLEKRIEDKRVFYSISIEAPPALDFTSLVEELSLLKGVVEASWSRGS